MESTKKIVILGSFGVGKTSLIRRFVTNEFTTDYKVTIGVHVLKKEVQIGENKISLILWDLEGTDDLQKINRAYLSGAHGYIYVFDLKRPSTYTNIDSDLVFLKESYNCNLIKVVGNKVDLLTEEEYKNIKTSGLNLDFLSSAKSGDNVEDLFNSIAKDLM